MMKCCHCWIYLLYSDQDSFMGNADISTTILQSSSNYSLFISLHQSFVVFISCSDEDCNMVIDMSAFFWSVLVGIKEIYSSWVTTNLEPPFTSMQPLFLDSLDHTSITLFTLAKQSKSMGAYKLARYTYDKLQVGMNRIQNVYIVFLYTFRGNDSIIILLLFMAIRDGILMSLSLALHMPSCSSPWRFPISFKMQLISVL